ncbi:MAG: DUF370 domain-containing protein [Clostridia bacterium]|nr:DUF370 domain-containing protein [Clostridia bacterium]
MKRKNNHSYFNIGGDKIIPGADIIGIFDIDNTTQSKHTRDFLNSVQQRGEVVVLAPDIPVSFVVTCPKDGTETVYLSQYAPRTLRQRRLF